MDTGAIARRFIQAWPADESDAVIDQLANPDLETTADDVIAAGVIAAGDRAPSAGPAAAPTRPAPSTASNPKARP
jgi:hypothetical protein